MISEKYQRKKGWWNMKNRRRCGLGKAMKVLGRLFCRHKHMTHNSTYLEQQPDGSWKTVHFWRCLDCGKVMR